MNDPRAWKWMVPGAGIGCVLMAQLWINEFGSPWMAYCIYGTVPVMLILAAQSVAMFWAYYSRLFTDQFVERRRALATTAETQLFEMARLMHPETVKLLLMHRKMKWRVKEAKLNELTDWVLDADPRVHVQFVEYVLENSSLYAMMPINRLSDNAYHFDPDRLVTDYDQYRAYHKLLVNRAMATDAFGNQPGQWIEPWTPELVARQFGIELTKEEMEDTPAPAPQAKKEAKEAVVQPSAPDAVKEKPLTDQDMENIRQLQEEHAKKYGLTVKEYFLKNNKS